MADPLVFIIKKIIFRSAYKMGKELGKELREAPKILRNPPSYDRLSDSQKIFAGTREEYEEKRRELLSKRVSGRMKEVLFFIADLAERIEKGKVTKSEYQNALDFLRAKSSSLYNWENELIYEIINDYF